jgi:predicted adenylyl cyclase CyaB
MKETEVKILEVDRSKIEEALRRLGATKVFDGEIETYFYDFGNRTIAKARNVMRLRREKGRIELTFKKVLVSQGAKVAEEYSVEVSDLEGAKRILESLGLSVVESLQKHRISYALEKAHFDFDKYEGKYSHIPEFLEIEAENIKAIYEFADLFGFAAKDCLPWSTEDLIRHYSITK